MSTFIYPSSITVDRKSSETLDFVGAKHCSDESIVKAENVCTAMPRPFLAGVTKEGYQRTLRWAVWGVNFTVMIKRDRLLASLLIRHPTSEVGDIRPVVLFYQLTRVEHRGDYLTVF